MDLWMMAANLLGMAVARAAGHLSDRGVDAATDKAMDGFLRLVKGKSPQAVAELETQGPTPVAKGVAGRLMEIEIQRDPAFAAAVAEYVEELKRLGLDRRVTPGMSLMAIAALAVAVAGLLITPCPWPVGGLLGVVGAVLGHGGLGQIRRTGEGGRGMALGAIIVGWTALVVQILIFVFYWMRHTSA